MNRRQFLYALTTFVASLGFGKIPLSAQDKEGPGALRDIAHHRRPRSSGKMLKSNQSNQLPRALAIKNMQQLGAVTSSFSAVGDFQKGTNFYDRVPTRYEQVIEQLNRAKEVIEFTGRDMCESPPISKTF